MILTLEFQAVLKIDGSQTIEHHEEMTKTLNLTQYPMGIQERSHVFKLPCVEGKNFLSELIKWLSPGIFILRQLNLKHLLKSMEICLLINCGSQFSSQIVWMLK